MSNPRAKHSQNNLLVLLVLVTWVVILSVVAYNRQGIIDYWRLHHYEVPTAVSQLATDDTMTNAGRNIYYVNQPQITSKSPFAAACPSGTEQTVVLGCYHSNQAGIYVLGVSDTRLNGVEQVTAAHETLHAVYDRLSGRQKTILDKELTDFYSHGLADGVVKAQIADYRKSEPHDITNEMHSLFGTEVTNLPPNLEAHYAKYFTNRAKVVDMYNAYQAEFSNRQATIKADDQRLMSLKSQITSSEADLQNRNKVLESQRAQLQSRRASGDIAGYNSLVAGFNAEIDAYNSAADTVRALIDQYNSLVNSRNAVAAETQVLVGEISNQVPTATQ